MQFRLHDSGAVAGGAILAVALGAAGIGAAAPRAVSQKSQSGEPVLGEAFPLVRDGSRRSIGDVPRALAVGDVTGDGIGDLVCGYATSDGGLVEVRPGRRAAEVRATSDAGSSEGSNLPFAQEARHFAIAQPVDFVATGDVTEDGVDEVVVASAAAGRIAVCGLRDDTLQQLAVVEADGEITALAYDSASVPNRLMAGVTREDGNSIATYEVRAGALQYSRSDAAPGRVASLVCGRFDDRPGSDVAFACDGAIALLGRPDARVEVGTRVRSLAAGRPGMGSRSGLTAVGEDGPVYEIASFDAGGPAAEVSLPSIAVAATGAGGRVASHVVSAVATRLNDDALNDWIAIVDGIDTPVVALTRVSAVFRVTTSVERGPGSLREAIESANASPGQDRIEFAIAFGPQTIEPVTALPDITDSVVLDGTTQSGYAGAPLVELLGNNGSHSFFPGLAGGSSAIRGMAFNRASSEEAAITVASNGNVFENCYFAVNLDGTPAYSNVAGDMYIVSNDNAIGDGTAAGRNIAQGFSASMRITDGSGNQIRGNYFGYRVDGDQPFGVAAGAIFLYGTATDNTIGGLADGEGNLLGGTIGLRAEPYQQVQTANVFLGNAWALFGDARFDPPAYGIGIPYGEVYAADPLDADEGPNGLQNPPLILWPKFTGGALRVIGELESRPRTEYRIELYAGPVPRRLGDRAEMLRPVGAVYVTTDANGFAAIDARVTAPVEKGWRVVATATGPDGTSTFSNAATAGKKAIVLATASYDSTKHRMTCTVRSGKLKVGDDVQMVVGRYLVPKASFDPARGRITGRGEDIDYAILTGATYVYALVNGQETQPVTFSVR